MKISSVQIKETSPNPTIPKTAWENPAIDYSIRRALCISIWMSFIFAFQTLMIEIPALVFMSD